MTRPDFYDNDYYNDEYDIIENQIKIIEYLITKEEIKADWQPRYNIKLPKNQPVMKIKPYIRNQLAA